MERERVRERERCKARKETAVLVSAGAIHRPAVLSTTWCRWHCHGPADTAGTHSCFLVRAQIGGVLQNTLDFGLSP